MLYRMMRVIRLALLVQKKMFFNIMHWTFAGSEVSICKVGLLLMQWNDHDHLISFPMSGTTAVHLGENQIWLVMRVSHGRRSRGDGEELVPQNLERGDCPPDLVMLPNFKHQITCITM